jgi:hypothetical protein
MVTLRVGWPWQHHVITGAKDAMVRWKQIAVVAAHQVSEPFQEANVFQTKVTFKTDLPLLLNATSPAENAR